MACLMYMHECLCVYFIHGMAILNIDRTKSVAVSSLPLLCHFLQGPLMKNSSNRAGYLSFAQRRHDYHKYTAYRSRWSIFSVARHEQKLFHLWLNCGELAKKVCCIGSSSSLSK